MDETDILSLHSDLSVTRREDGRMAVRGSRGQIEPVPTAFEPAMQKLASKGATLDALFADLKDDVDPRSVAALSYCLHGLDLRGLLVRTVMSGTTPLISVIRLSRTHLQNVPPLSASTRYALSPNAYIRAVDECLTVEAPDAQIRVMIHDARVASFCHFLARPGTLEQLYRVVSDLTPRECDAVLLRLFVGGLVEPVQEQPPDPARYWEFHDLLFHTRSRNGRHGNRAGATFRFASDAPQPPSHDIPAGSQGIALPRSHLTHRPEPGLSQVLDRRRSIREYDPEPIGLSEIGPFLYQSARDVARHEVRTQAPCGEVRFDVARRPYPSAGSLHPLRLYLLALRCGGLAYGLYRYDGLDHRLIRVDAAERHLTDLCADAAAGAGIAANSLQALFVISAIVPRVAWKYEGLAYAAVLKEVGVLYQTMYLVATALNLAPCALGYGNSEVFARATGHHFLTESAVGEFLLGRKPRREEARA